jgi:hypothetical protein
MTVRPGVAVTADDAVKGAATVVPVPATVEAAVMPAVVAPVPAIVMPAPVSLM